MFKNSKFMEIAIQEAKKITNNQNVNEEEVPIIAIIVKNDQIIALKNNQNIGNCDATAHAEILAIREACQKLNSKFLEDCEIYITLEPCPMCYGAISLARIKKIFLLLTILKKSKRKFLITILNQKFTVE